MGTRGRLAGDLGEVDPVPRSRCSTPQIAAERKGIAMATLPRHGTIRRYKSGCRCAPCSAKNTAEKAKERDARRAREGKPPARVPASRRTVPTGDSAPHADPAHGPIETAAREALGNSETDAITKLRREVVFAAARIMDDPLKPHLFKGQAEVMRVTVLDLVGLKPPEDGEADELRRWMETIGSTRGRRNRAEVHDAPESEPPVDR